MSSKQEEQDYAIILRERILKNIEDLKVKINKSSSEQDVDVLVDISDNIDKCLDFYY